jgi:hypothetical protein
MPLIYRETSTVLHGMQVLTNIAPPEASVSLCLRNGGFQVRSVNVELGVFMCNPNLCSDGLSAKLTLQSNRSSPDACGQNDQPPPRCQQFWAPEVPR